MAPTHNLHSAMNEIPQSSISLAQGMKVRSPRSKDSVRTANTLQSVLRGEVPSEYVHLTSQRRTGEVSQNQNFEFQSSPVGVNCDRSANGTLFTMESERFVPSPHPNSPAYISPSVHPGSPQYVTSAQALSPHPASPRDSETHFIESKSIYGNGSPFHDGSLTTQYYERCSPAYDSRSSPFSESGSPFIDRGPSPYYHMDSPYHSCSPHSGSPYYAPQSPFQPHSPYTSEGYSSDVQESFISNDKPIDLSCKSDNSFDSNEQISGFDGTHNGSLLRNLLSSGKQKLFGSHENNSDRDSPCSDIYKPEVPVTGSTRVTLAKKMIHPITSRVSDWLVKIVQFAKSIPEFSSLSHNDKVTLVINSWTRILLLLMAENEFEFAVTPRPAEKDNSDVTPSADEPTMKSVEGLQSFIKKCKNMSLDQKEYALLRMSVLFNSGYVGLDDVELIEKLNSAVQQLLQQHVTAARPGDVMHYSRLLLCLPALYGINCKMIENLFCRRLNSNMDMEVLLKEMLQTL